MRKSWVCAIAFLLLAPGCSSKDSREGSDAVREADLRFEYIGAEKAGMIDQTVTITNRSGTSAAVPTLSFAALDSAGRLLEEVTVSTVFGSDRGRVVVPAEYEVFDVLRFEGPGADRVEDVDVSVKALDSLDDSGTVYPEIDYLDDEGQSVAAPFMAESVRVLNSGTQDYVVRLVGIEWDVPAPGRPQQALRVTPVGDPAAVGADSTVDVVVPDDLRGRFDSLKCYISTR